MKIFAHRGFSGRYPESTRQAFEEAVRAGVDGFECDVRLTKDNIPIVFHDRTTERILGKRIAVGAKKLQELQEFLELFTLEELIQLSIKKRVDLLIETKHPVIKGNRVEKEVLALIEKYSQEIGESGIEIWVISFSRRAVRYLRRNYIKVGSIINHRYQIFAVKTPLVAVDIELLKRDFSLIRRFNNRILYVWTVNQPGDFRLISQKRISGVITDFPNRAERLLYKRKNS
jgi:glycerophosphoryl diester phosphodiesterase